jgi:hypothetical protein
MLFAAQGVSAQQRTQKAPPLVDPLTNCSVRYYYYPNLQAYFDTKTKLYIFKVKGVWTKAEEIPNGYMGYGLYNKVNVYITDYDDDDITQFIQDHKKKFPYQQNGRMRQVTASAE